MEINEIKTPEQLIEENRALRERVESLEQSEFKYHTLFTRMIDGYALHEIILDESGKPVDYRFLDINPAFTQLTGLTRDIVGKTVLEIIPGLEQYWIDIYGKVALTGESTKFENYSGPLEKWFEIVAFRPAENQFACIFIDITQRKQDEAELRHLRNLLSNIVNSMPSMLIGVDPDGKVTQWNHEAENITGITAQKAQGKSLIDVFPKITRQMEKVKYAIEHRKPLKDTKIPTEQDGATRFTDITVYPLIDNGVEGAVIRIDDVTERVRIEELMIQSEKMMTVGGLAAGMAHEINNPLAGILQNIQVMENRFREDLPKNIKAAESCGINMQAVRAYMEQRNILEMMEAVKDSGHRASQIVENMLSFSRKSESKAAPYNLAKLLDKTLELVSNDYDLKKKYDFRKVEIMRDYDPDIKVRCEVTKIQQVFINIFKNGAQAMAENRKEGKEPRFTLRIKSEDGFARVEIEDNGPGMDKNTRKRIFEPFFTTKETNSGTGLGMSISYFIITENHGGTLSVESVPGKGAKFVIRLPRITSESLHPGGRL